MPKEFIFFVLIGFLSIQSTPTVQETCNRAMDTPRYYTLKINGHNIFSNKKLLTIKGTITNTRGTITTIETNNTYSGTQWDYAQALWEGYCQFLMHCQQKRSKILYIKPFRELKRRGSWELQQELDRAVLDPTTHTWYILLRKKDI